MTGEHISLLLLSSSSVRFESYLSSPVAVIVSPKPFGSR